jgi:hypothetical protein
LLLLWLPCWHHHPWYGVKNAVWNFSILQRVHTHISSLVHINYFPLYKD